MTMRTKPLIGTKPWFGPRRFGWGLDPVSVEGWAVTVGAVGGLIVAHARGVKNPKLIGPALLAIAVLKGTSPGGPRARRAFLEGRASS